MRVEFRDGLVTVWPKGTRQRRVINVAAAWQRVVKAEVDEERRQRHKGRKR
jgi:hypothetical protein